MYRHCFTCLIRVLANIGLHNIDTGALEAFRTQEASIGAGSYFRNLVKNYRSV